MPATARSDRVRCPQLRAARAWIAFDSPLRSAPRAASSGSVMPAPAACSARNVCFTTRSSSEWNVITTIRPPARAGRQRASRNPSSPSSSRFTQMRIAWNVRVAGSIREYPLRGIARRTMSASRPVVVDRPRPAAPRRSPAPPAARAAPRRTGRSRRPASVRRPPPASPPRSPARRVHPHVERLVAPEAEPPIRRVELHRRHAEIRQHPVHRRRCRARRARRRVHDSRCAPARPDRRTPPARRALAPAPPDRGPAR